LLEGIIEFSKKSLDPVLKKSPTLNDAIKLYDTHRQLVRVINAIYLTSGHYLSLTFNEEYLQNSSLGSPIDKWSFFLNKDLLVLNNSVKDWLINLACYFNYFEGDQ